ncbi:hypothetical protein ACJMK2_028361 [Sinanodonta woodiana]|uniref:Uncharacterized protein n=1 Tax=Sinanodonta woodiana TaxID=1069815 RepID=A0ABD3X6W3_SINWO
MIEANSDENYNNHEKAFKDTNEPIQTKGDIKESPSTGGTKGISQDGTSEQNIDDPNISQAIHTWKGYEEDLLVSLRHDKRKHFAIKINHSQLCAEIASEINEHFN